MKPKLFEVDIVMNALRRKRAVFHSEADFQFAFAWETKLIYQQVEVRLETHPRDHPQLRLDLQILDIANGDLIAIELKYLTRAWSGIDELARDEAFELKNHGAHDHRRYDVVKDIHRIERFIQADPSWRGFAVVISNDAAYWEQPIGLVQSNDAAFRIHDGASLSGDRKWAAQTASTKDRYTTLGLGGRYLLKWIDYSKVDATSAGTFRSLTVPILRSP